ncbi:MAG: peptide deformylase [Actinomycetota bacterium]|nr:peptide deformylase [Actinomycetota bacterium]
MAVLAIRTFGDPALRQRAAEVARVTDLHRRIIEDMFETMRDAPGVGLAGPQIGVMERIFVWEVDERSGAVINPVIVSRSEETDSAEEGCLSLPGIYYPVTRSARVTVEGLDASGEPVSLEADELLARVCQHEIDHLDGVLFVDHLSDEQRKEALARLREQALGLTPSTAEASRHPTEETL